jgi:hypothetical protein
VRATVKGDGVSVLKQQNQALGVIITPETNQMPYYEAKVNIDWAVSALFDCEFHTPGAVI